MKELIYKGDRKFLILFPIDLLVENGTKVTPKDEKEKDMFLELEFEEVKPKKEGVK